MSISKHSTWLRENIQQAIVRKIVLRLTLMLSLLVERSLAAMLTLRAPELSRLKIAYLDPTLTLDGVRTSEIILVLSGESDLSRFSDFGVDQTLKCHLTTDEDLTRHIVDLLLVDILHLLGFLNSISSIAMLWRSEL